MPHRTHSILEFAALAALYFRAHLYRRNEVLVGKRIDDKPGSHGVGSQEDEVAIAQGFCDLISRDIPGDRHQHGINRHLARMANSDLVLKLPRFDVDAGGANHTREIGALNLVRIDENEVPNAK